MQPQDIVRFVEKWITENLEMRGKAMIYCCYHQLVDRPIGHLDSDEIKNLICEIKKIKEQLKRCFPEIFVDVTDTMPDLPECRNRFIYQCLNSSRTNTFIVADSSFPLRGENCLTCEQVIAFFDSKLMELEDALVDQSELNA
jgi:hypothetical protein